MNLTELYLSYELRKYYGVKAQHQALPVRSASEKLQARFSVNLKVQDEPHGVIFKLRVAKILRSESAASGFACAERV